MSVRSIAVAGGPSEKLLDPVSDADLSPVGKTLAALGRYENKAAG